ncbi:MAG: hypothetical protein JSW01_03665 [Candidatus Bathyarchaeota archaeon]|nr:MAG: hypothetical protein JSW01_03665 [Candidatus Bathyarchaeota archaeon]
MKGSEAIANILKQEGVKYVPCFPGGGAIDIINALADVPEVQTVLTRHERVACDIADGYARATNDVGVVLPSQGPGVAHAFAGIAQSYSDGTPVLCLAGQVSRQLIGTQAVQEVQDMDFFRSVAKWVGRINLIERIPEMMRRAFTVLRSGQRRPVVLSIPSDISSGEVEDEKLAYDLVAKGWTVGGDPRDIEQAAKALISAKNPLIHAGAGVLYSKAWDELQELAELLQAPVTSTLNAKGVFPENHPLSLGLAGRIGTKQAAHFLRKADILFAIGNSFRNRRGGMGIPVPRGIKLIHSNISELDINRVYKTDLGILGDAKLVLRQLTEAVKKLTGGKRKEDENLQKEISKVRKEWLNEWMPRLTSDEVPINPYRFTWDLMQTVDKDNTIVTHDAGLPRWHVSHFYEATFPRSYLGMGGQSEMAWSLGAAMGAKLAHPDKLVVCVMGDGAYGMTGMEMETAVRNDIPILVVVTNNQGLGMYEVLTPSTSKLSGDYSKVAEGLGAYAERVEKPDDIVPAIKRASRQVKDGTPALLDVVVKLELIGDMRKSWDDLYADEKW